MAAFQYYYLKSKFSGKVLDVEGGGRNPGTRVIMFHKKQGFEKFSGVDNQLWYTDNNGAIRSKMNDFVLDASRGDLVLNPFDPNNPSQRWAIVGETIRLMSNQNKCMDVKDQNKNDGAHVCVWDYNGGDNQKWSQETTGYRHHGDQPSFAPPAGPPQGAPPGYPGYPSGPPEPGFPGTGFPGAPQYPPAAGFPPPYGAPPGGQRFFIRSAMHGKVLDVEGENRMPGARVIVYGRKPGQPAPNQLFYSDQTGCIRSAMNDFCLDTGTGQLTLQPFNNSPTQQWVAQGDRIVNRFNNNDVLDIAEQNPGDGAHVIAYSWQGSANQRWHLDYV